MEVQIPKKYLADSLSHIERIIPNRSSNPNLSLLFIEVKDNKIILRGSNLEIDIESSLSADIDFEKNETFAVPANVFGQIVRSLPGELVVLGFSENEMSIASGNYGTKLQLVKDIESSNISFPETYSGSIDGKIFAKLLSHVRYAAAVAEYQAIFRGIKLELKQNHTRAIATDGFRLAYYDANSSSGLEEDIVIPARSVDELIKLLSDDEAKIAVENNQLSILNGAFKVNLKLMDGTFPDYEKIIPTDFPLKISLDAESFAGSIKRVALMADKTGNNRIGIFIKEGLLQITAEGSYGRAQEELAVKQEGDEAEIALAYNANYLIDALKPIKGEVNLAFSALDRPSPSVLRSVDDPKYLAMVVPLRI
ncbi:MAG TPA: DNA polymerase III subunit beta [Trueperaceae bacterium]|nr:DNA polymerase III subunit beta [Trueperaceae bacterium]